jgi:hypothetical protein
VDAALSGGADVSASLTREAASAGAGLGAAACALLLLLLLALLWLEAFPLAKEAVVSFNRSRKESG